MGNSSSSIPRSCVNVAVSEQGRLTKQQFIEYYTHKHPTVTPTKDGVWSYETRLLIATPCECSRPECAGWVMVTQDALANGRGP